MSNPQPYDFAATFDAAVAVVHTVPVGAVACGLAALAAALILAQRMNLRRLRFLAEHAFQAQHADAAAARAALAETERAVLGAVTSGNTHAMGRALDAIRAATDAVAVSSERVRRDVTQELRAMREGNEARLAEIRVAVDEQLRVVVERQMAASFARVLDQFAALQGAMAEVQATAAQVGDLKRLFGNVRARGGWGEAQLRATLDDTLPPGAYETNWKPRQGSDEVVEFALVLPARGDAPPRLPVDAKFPTEDYERLLAASEAGDADGERAARRGLERRIRDEAKRIATKYIHPPATVEFAVLYLPTDGLYAEVARIPGLIDDLGRDGRILVLGPSLFPALLRTLHLGHITLSLERRAEEVREMLAATRTEMLRMDEVLDKLGRQAGAFTATIDRARARTRAVDRRLRDVAGLSPAQAEALLHLEPDAAD